MKAMKKLASLALALVMALALAAPAMAAGNNSITVENAAKGATYTLYKVFDAKVVEDREINDTGITYSYEGDLPASLAVVFEKDAAKDTIVAKENATSADIMAAVKTWAETATKVDEKTATDGGKVTFTGLEDGYYAVLSDVSEGNSVTLTSIAPDATVYDKNTASDKPTNAKKELVDGNGNVLSDKTVSIGETIYYKVSVTAVNWIDKDGDAANGAEHKVTSYTVLDNNGEELDFLDNLKIVNITVTEPGGIVKNVTGFGDNVIGYEIPWVDDDGNHLYANGSTLAVLYSARVEASILKYTADNPARNTATINPNGYTITDDDDLKEDVFTYSFQLAKTAGDTTTLLADAEFELYDAQNGGNLIPLVKLDENTWSVATAAEAEADGFVSEKIVTNGDSVITIEGLGNGTYYLEETEAPAGYNKLAAREAVTIKDADSTIAVVDGVWTGNGIQVVNNSGAELPSTGGIGTTIFYVGGGILVVGAAILLITKKRMSTAE